ncbi:hypothetical protein SASPL_133306 [Salvia splendens]|uniref:Transaldolase n=2 Tax=Salvia splendens TaxID=180675 RepID=A0A8X8X414_SALSN|nr:hypothetical protein SASPL_133306 [Salvia splendens]
MKMMLGLSTELDVVTGYSEIVPDTVVSSTAATVSSSLLLGICRLPDTEFKSSLICIKGKETLVSQFGNNLTVGETVLLWTIAESAVDTALASSECYTLENSDDRMSCFFDKALVNVGGDLAKLVPGRVSTEVDARLAYDTHGIIRKVHDLLKLYNEIGVSPERLLFKIPSTWQGIEASRLLELEGIQTHMTFVYRYTEAFIFIKFVYAIIVLIAAITFLALWLCMNSFVQAGASVIQIFVGRLRDWARNHTGDLEIEAALKRGEDPGLALVTKAYNYVHKYGHNSKLMAAAVRNKQDVFNLLGVDYIISALKILQSLKESVTPPDEKYSFVRRLSPQSAASYNFSEEEVSFPFCELIFELVTWDQYSFASALDSYASQSKRVEELFGKIWPPPNV